MQHHDFFVWRFRWLFAAPFLALAASLVLTAAGSASRHEQLRRLGAYHAQAQKQLPTLETVLLHLAEDYIAPERLDPPRLLKSGVMAIERRVPECLLEYPVDEVLQMQCSGRTARVTLSQIANIEAVSGAMQKFLSILPPAGLSASLKFDIINAMLAELDPHTNLLDPDVYRELKTGTQGSFSGVGIVVTVRNGYLTVIAPMDGSPAARAGIRPGDRIVRIGDVSVANTSLAEAVNFLRGRPGTSVSVWVERENESQWLHFVLQRSVIQLSSVESRMLPENVAYVRIRQFSQNTSAELRRHLERLLEQGAQKLILDLSSNPGGLLSQAEKSASLFLENSIIFSTVGRNHRVEDVRRATSTPLWRRPMAVLINGGSASAAEILAGTLKVNERALVMGETSFGKGSIQVIHEFEDDSALKMTVAHYLAGGRLPIHARGVNPHVRVHYIDVDENPFHLTHPEHLPPRQEEAPLFGPVEDPVWADLHLMASQGKHIQDMDTQAPPELIDAARRLLAENRGAWDPQAIAAWAARESARSQEAFIAQLGRKGVDWNDGETDFSRVKLDAKLRLSVADDAIRAGETLAGLVTLHNLGTAPAHRLVALVRGGLDGTVQEYPIGKLGPGERYTLAFSFTVPQGHPMGPWPVFVRFACLDPHAPAGTGYLPADMETWVRVQPAAQNDIRVHYHFMDDISGNGDGLLQPGERGRIRMHVMNAGTERNSGVTMGFRGLPSGVEITPSRFVWEPLSPGETRTRDFLVQASENAEPSETLPLAFLDFRTGVRMESRLPLHVSPPAPGPVDTQGMFLVRTESPLSGCAGQERLVLGFVEKGASFPVLGTQGQWVKIQLAPDRTAFVSRNAGALASPDATPLLSPRWSPAWQMVQPRIDVVQALPLRTGERERFSVRVSHPWRLMDAVVEVFGENRAYRKILFISSDGRNELHLAPMVPLFPGKNRLVVTARSTPDLSNRWEQITYRQP